MEQPETVILGGFVNFTVYYWLFPENSKNAAGMNTPRDCSPIHGFRDIFPFHRNCSSEIMEWLGTMRLAVL